MRRELLCIFVLLTAQAIALPATRTNILLIIVDDLRPELGCYGHEHMHTPHIDKLASAGMVFDRAHCNVPVCMPSRVSLLTSLRTDRTMGRTEKLGRDFISLPKYLGAHGYTTISNGKVFHHLDDRSEDWSEPPWRSVPIYHGERPWATYNTYGLWQNEEAGMWINPETGFGPYFDSADVPDDAYQDGKVANKTIDRMLFDHDHDPGENQNIADNPEMAEIINHLSHRISSFTASSSFRRRIKMDN